MRRLSRIRAIGALAGFAGLFPAAAQTPVEIRFTRVSEEAGILFEHINGATEDKHLPETMGSGGLIFDFDNDTWPDILLVNGGSMVDPDQASLARHHLYRNLGDGTFNDVTDRAGLGTSGYGLGACAADYDNDGWRDLYITSVGENRLYRNLGDGQFMDVTERARVGSPLWSSSCAFGDLDNDGDLDLYVTNYVDYSVDNNKYCTGTEGTRAYCHPNVYNGEPDALYRNNGDGTFSDISRDAGIYTTAGKGLGVVLADYDDDGWLDIYVANDSVANFLYRNLKRNRFEEAGMWAGVAVGMDGKPLAGMGTDIADIDGDGRLDVFVTNLNRQTHNLYQNLGGGLFADATFESGVGVATLPFVGFGTVFFDYDNDADLDLAIADGDVLDHDMPGRPPQAQMNLLMANDGRGRFTVLKPAPADGFAAERVSRALATGDIDNDGDLDVLITNNGGSPDLLRNELPMEHTATLIRLVGRESNRDGIGARLRLRLGELTLTRTVRAGSSYQSQSDLRVHFGLNGATVAGPLEIRWPTGRIERFETIEAGQTITITEGEGITGRIPFVR
jgi:enediyne biosynthesis protein E4